MHDSRPDRWRAVSPFAVRICGLPVSAVHQVRHIVTAGVAEVIAETDEWIAAEGHRLADLLFAAIGELGQSPARPRLIGLRRAVHGGRLPTSGEWNTELAAELPAWLATKIDHWLTALAGRPAKLRDLQTLLTTEVAEKDSVLRDTLSLPAFRRALAMASPELLDESDKWAACPSRRPRTRRLSKLMKFLARATMKTSPFSTFMFWGSASFTGASFTASSSTAASSSPSVVRWAAPLRPHGVLELEGAFMQAVRDALARHPALAASVPLAANPSLTFNDGRALFLGRPDQETIMSVASTPILRACLDIIESGARTLPELHDEMTHLVDAAQAGQIGDYLAALVRSGVVEPVIPVADTAPDFFGELASWLAGQETHELDATRDTLEAVSAEIRRRIPVSDVDKLRKSIDVLRREAARLSDQLGLGAFECAIAGNLHDTAVVPEPVGTCSEPAWQAALSDLDVVRRFCALFDERLRVQIVLGEFIFKRFGNGARVPFLVLYQAVQEVLTTPAGQRHDDVEEDLAHLLLTEHPEIPAVPTELRSPRLHALEALQAKARALLMVDPGPDSVTRIDPAELVRQITQWPGWVVAHTSMSCFVQAVGGNGQDLRLVLNMLFRGHGAVFARTRRLIEQVGGSIAACPHAQREGGPVPVELSGLQGSTLNAGTAGTRYELDYPFAVSARPRDERIPLSDLVVTHDPLTGVVGARSASLDRPILPVHRGLSGTFTSPPAGRLLDRIFGYPYHKFAGLSPLDDMSPTRGHRTRLEVGRVVLRREQWYFPADAVPGRRPGDDNATYLVRLVAWRRAAGLPDRCFATFLSSPETGWTRRPTPLYVDFANLYLIVDFEKQCQVSEFVLLQEVLPDVTDALGPDPADRRSTEFVIELSDSDVEAVNA